MTNVPAPPIEAQAFWTATSTNSKTGNIPQQWIGGSDAETRATCAGCPLLRAPGASPLAGPECYAFRGTVHLAAGSVRRRAGRKPRLYTLRHALARRMLAARAVRFAAIGCVCGVKHTLHQDLDLIRAQGLAPLAYCHHAARHPDLAGLVTASTGTVAEARAAFAAGFLKVALVVPASTTAAQACELGAALGVCARICPADVSAVRIGGRTQYRTTCNDCRLCDGTAGPRTLVLFPEKGRPQRLLQIRPTWTGRPPAPHFLGSSLGLLSPAEARSSLDLWLRHHYVAVTAGGKRLEQQPVLDHHACRMPLAQTRLRRLGRTRSAAGNQTWSSSGCPYLRWSGEEASGTAEALAEGPPSCCYSSRANQAGEKGRAPQERSPSCCYSNGTSEAAGEALKEGPPSCCYSSKENADRACQGTTA
jgi:hypothetical protein